MNTFGTFLGVLKSSFYATSSTTLHVYSQNVHQRNVHEIDEEVKISARLLHSRVIYIFASHLEGYFPHYIREKRFIHVYTFATMNMMITSHRR